MTAAAQTTTAVGGQRQVPVPDPVARDYLLLGLRLDQHIPGTVDGYFGPADLKAQVDLEQLRPPARLAEDAAALLDRVAAEAAARPAASGGCSASSCPVGDRRRDRGRLGQGFLIVAVIVTPSRR